MVIGIEVGLDNREPESAEVAAYRTAARNGRYSGTIQVRYLLCNW